MPGSLPSRMGVIGNLHRRPAMPAALSALRSERWLGVALAGMAALLLVAAEYVLRHTWNGDASIYLPYARNASNGDFFSFNPHQFSSGSTSPLWSLLLAIPVGLSGALGALKAFYALASLIALATAFGAAVRTTGSWLGAALGSFYVITTLTVPASLGFESPLAVALVATSIWLCDRLVREERLRPHVLAAVVLVWAMLPLARPDAVLLVPIEAAALWLARGRARRDLMPLVAAIAVAAIPAAIYFAYSLSKLGVPSTSAAGRSEWLRTHGHRFGPFYTSTWALKYLFSSPIAFAFVPALAGLALLTRDRARRFTALAGGGAIVAYVLLLTFISPGFLDTSRYLLPIAPFVVIGIAALFRAVAGRRAAVMAAGIAAAAALICLPAANVLKGDAFRMRDIPYSFDNNLERGAADVLNRRAGPGATVLAYEVQVRWFLRPDLSVLSLDGITDGKVLPYIRRDDLDGFLRRYRPRYWVADPTADPPEPGANRSVYIMHSSLGRAMARLRANPSLRSVTDGGIVFHVIARRPGPLPYRFGPWTAVLELRYGS